MSIYRIIRIAGDVGYKVHVTTASTALRVIGIFPTSADATEWIATDRECVDASHGSRHRRGADFTLDGG